MEESGYLDLGLSVQLWWIWKYRLGKEINTWVDRAEQSPETDPNKYDQWFFFKYKGK